MSEPGSLIRSLSGRQSARNFHSYVISEIGVGIASGRLPVGSILPNDAEMMDTYGVSRTVLREALKTLEAKGLVEARAKVGTRVLPKSRWNLFDRQVLSWIHEAGPDAAFLRSFVEVREALEIPAAREAAEKRNADDVRMLHYWLKQRRAVTALPEPFALAEFELHRTICEASHNPFLRAATGVVEFGNAQSTVRRLEAGVTDLAAEKETLYQALVDAVERGSATEAASVMADVLKIDRDWILGV
ncbi:FadR family transcriptional regulator [Tabrizicola sp. J26]|uniref:FadR/GntR family transcriptional regulator n=1 Tax=Alitabrizicola rongguiensis TaxID=2909234 RepID=UPI001F223375|nr:FadR/GntR family transcriptional regulator [Tabrizicola rongguiensis]MCF1709345.1 FadR family transcriptional regulator [Tabrizicola rongguiensis]